MFAAFVSQNERAAPVAELHRDSLEPQMVTTNSFGMAEAQVLVEAKVGVDMDRLAASKSAPGPKGKARGEIRGETIALTAVLC